jgi:RNA-splicing ligase RtcB
MTEEEIERRVEKMVDHLDRVFLAGQMSQGDYDKAMRDLDQWADAKRKEEWRKPYQWRGTLNGV